mmetsp:Transcript_14581/g.26415  ORF Transcript_14581/g.26415 Transcript_14581/m.26415 type:complete len:151 (+) Transcript_14581:348-800(+)
MSSLTQRVEDDCRDTTFEQDSAERKRLISHVLQMRASLERYLNQKLARQPRQPRMLIQMIRQFGSLSKHPKNVPIQEYCAAMMRFETMEIKELCICPARTRMLGSGRKVFGFEGYALTWRVKEPDRTWGLSVAEKTSLLPCTSAQDDMSS